MSSTRPVTAGISGPTPDTLRANLKGPHRFQFTPTVKVGKMLEGARYFFGTNFKPVASGVFTMTGELGQQKVVLTFNGYAANGPTGQGQVTVELKADFDARQPRPTVVPDADASGAGASASAK